MITPPMCEDCLELHVLTYNSTTHVLTLGVTLTNQYPFDGCDVRGIVFTDNVGHMINNPDSWTPLYDKPGGKDLNPFMAFAQNEPGRIFESGKSYTQTFYVLMTSWSVPVQFAVDASWPGNCEEPYWIEVLGQEAVLPTLGASGRLYVNVCDWQDDITDVFLKSENYFGTEDLYPFTYLQGSTWEANITNINAKPMDKYEAKIIAFSEGSDELTLHNFHDLEVGIPATNPWYPAFTVTVDGDYAYAIDGPNLDIYNIADPEFPYHISRNKIPGSTMIQSRPIVVDGYAYVAEINQARVNIFDIDPPFLAEQIGYLEFIDVRNLSLGDDGYLYTMPRICKIDISDPPNAFVEEYEIFHGKPKGHIFRAEIINGFAYMTCGSPSPHNFIVGDLASTELVLKYNYDNDIGGYMIFRDINKLWVMAEGVDPHHTYLKVHNINGADTAVIDTIDLGEFLGYGFCLGFSDSYVLVPAGDLYVVTKEGYFVDQIDTLGFAWCVDSKQYGNDLYAVVANGTEGLTFELLDY